jgi:hypothetical protein
MKNQILSFKEQLNKQIKINTSFIESSESESVECAWQHLYQASRVLLGFVESNKEWEEQSIDTSCMMLLLNCQSDILNALISTLQGFSQGPGLLLRSVIENLASTIVIKTDSEKFLIYKKNKLNPSKCISSAKKIFPELGGYYGLFSNFYVHENYHKIGRSIKAKNGYFNFTLLPAIDKSDLTIILLLEIALLSRFSGALSEFCLVHKTSDFYYWRKSGEFLKEFKGNEEDKLLGKLIKNADGYLNSLEVSLTV